MPTPGSLTKSSRNSYFLQRWSASSLQTRAGKARGGTDISFMVPQKHKCLNPGIQQEVSKLHSTAALSLWVPQTWASFKGRLRTGKMTVSPPLQHGRWKFKVRREWPRQSPIFKNPQMSAEICNLEGMSEFHHIPPQKERIPLHSSARAPTNSKPKRSFP